MGQGSAVEQMTQLFAHHVVVADGGVQGLVGEHELYFVLGFEYSMLAFGPLYYRGVDVFSTVHELDAGPL